MSTPPLRHHGAFSLARNGSAGMLTLNAGQNNGAITISTTNAAGINILSIGNPPPACKRNAFLNNTPRPRNSIPQGEAC